MFRIIKNNKKPIVVLISIVIIILSIFILKITTLNTEIELTQFSAENTTSQMMGYEIKTKSGKVVLVDSGTKSNTETLIEKIGKDGGKVDYWFITHPHHDHAEAFCDIIEKTNIPIDKIYISLNEAEWYEKNCEPHRIEFAHRILNIINNSRIKEKVIQPNLNDKIQIDKNLTAEILGIRNPEITENAMNEQSMVISFNTGKNKILFLGDTRCTKL